MKPTTKEVVLITILALPVLLVFADEYPALRFRGDGHFSGGPVFGYWIRLNAIPFGQAGDYIFHFRGMPKEEMSLQLYTDGESDRSVLTNLSTQLEAVLTDQKGRVVCTGAGVVPKEGDLAVALREVAYGVDGVLDVLCARISVISPVQTKAVLPVGLGGNSEVDARLLPPE